ncbi:MAG: MFS transporter [Rickettsiaceae bacterium]|nr:MFS transporter [Rickettsiaceae bacterium]
MGAIAIKFKDHSALSPIQKEAIGLLSIGTFLEHFDLLLYVHMAVLLNGIFFPKTDAHTAALLSAFAFCSTYVLRPVGAIIFGYLGDNIGRKATVVITTSIMAVSCVVMATLPTYEQIGITAAYIVTICRALQGMASMGEVVGADLYITETVKPPAQYSMVMLISVCSVLGGVGALGLAKLVTSFGFNWRNAFWFGTIIAIIGAVARRRLRETPDFVDAKRRIMKAAIASGNSPAELKKSTLWKGGVNRKIAVSLFFIECAWPVSFYFSFIYCADILKNTFGFTAEQIIYQNLIAAILQLIGWAAIAYLSSKIHPLKIVMVRLMVFLIFLPFFPYWLANASSPQDILFLQAFTSVFGLMGKPAMPIFYKYFPVLQRFTYVTFTYAFARALIYIITSFGLVYCSAFFGSWSIIIIMLPITVIFVIAILHFVMLENISLFKKL